MLKLDVQPKRTVPIVGSILLLTAALLLAFFYTQDLKQRETVITTDTIREAGQGRITNGVNRASEPYKITSPDRLTFESKELATSSPTTTAAVVNWEQSGEGEGVKIELRTFDGAIWSPWILSESGEEGRDDKPLSHSAIILSKDIKKVQYKFQLEGQDGANSPIVDLNTVSIDTIDTSRGPSVDQKTMWRKITQSVKLDDTAYARTGQPAPHIYSRAEWGSPEPESSPNWEPEYRELDRAIVHHTATTATADSAAAIRAIWQFHTYGRGWGDIGYNYLVDQSGRIFQGRYFDHGYAYTNDVDVVGGHALGHNYGSTGISALGDFTNTNPSSALLYGIGYTASYKLGAYNIDPGSGGRMIGHRDVGQTACPGERLYAQLPTVRSIASSVFPQYRLLPFSWQFMGQYAYTDETKSTPVNLMNLSRGQRVYVGFKAKNVGTREWSNSGPNPIRVGTSRPQERRSAFCDNSWQSCSRPATMLESEVAKGGVGTFEFWYQVPLNGGRYDEYFNLLAEGSMWMNDIGQHFPTYAEPARYTYQLNSQYAYTDQTKNTQVDLSKITPGQRVYVGLSAKNTGNVTWTNSGANAVKLGTSGPQERVSPFCDNTWASCRRPATLTQASVAPGGNGTFEFWFKAPTNPGEYFERFTPLAEGIVWMNETGLGYYSRVLHPSATTQDGDRLISGQVLGTGQAVNSKDGRFSLILQGDGNLVLYTPRGVSWHTATHTKPVNRLIFQPDGNLVLYDAGGRPYWNSRTVNNNPGFLQLQNDGNLVLRNGIGGLVWHTGTAVAY